MEWILNALQAPWDTTKAAKVKPGQIALVYTTVGIVAAKVMD